MQLIPGNRVIFQSPFLFLHNISYVLNMRIRSRKSAHPLEIPLLLYTCRLQMFHQTQQHRHVCDVSVTSPTAAAAAAPYHTLSLCLSSLTLKASRSMSSCAKQRRPLANKGGLFWEHHLGDTPTRMPDIRRRLDCFFIHTFACWRKTSLQVRVRGFILSHVCCCCCRESSLARIVIVRNVCGRIARTFSRVIIWWRKVMRCCISYCTHTHTAGFNDFSDSYLYIHYTYISSSGKKKSILYGVCI